MAAEKKKGVDLAIVLGGKPPMEGGEDEEMSEGPGFTELAQQLFPDHDPEDLRALIQSCVDEGYD